MMLALKVERPSNFGIRAIPPKRQNSLVQLRDEASRALSATISSSDENASLNTRLLLGGGSSPGTQFGP